MGQMVIRDSNVGLRELEWNPDDPVEVEAMSLLFKEQIDKGKMAYVTNGVPNKHEQIHDFDPKADTITLQDPLYSG